ncbi:hypothetical protein AWC38_SpisGene20056 [Stylophora pistillata]|uniref:Uncharacterized protein n=1 Tax=Stylophora pistillata TaxID=50429 RepID=A0A2B4RHJ0_STYPI|nr:hypothetical protein AWC38_SpisGene20056 [Stylophora pistillata]
MCIEDQWNSGHRGPVEQWVQRTSRTVGTVGTEDQWSSGYRKPVEHWVQRTSGTVEQWAQRTSGTVGAEEQWVQRTSGTVGTVGIEDQWEQRTRRTVGTGLMGTEDQRNSGNRGLMGTKDQLVHSTGGTDCEVSFFKWSLRGAPHSIFAPSDRCYPNGFEQLRHVQPPQQLTRALRHLHRLEYEVTKEEYLRVFNERSDREIISKELLSIFLDKHPQKVRLRRKHNVDLKDDH